EVEGQLGCGLPVVLGEECERSRSVARFRSVNGLARRIGAAHDKAGEGMTGRTCETRERGFLVVEREGARQVTRFVSIVPVTGEFSPELQSVLAVRGAVGVLVEITLRGVDIFTPITDHLDELD